MSVISVGSPWWVRMTLWRLSAEEPLIWNDSFLNMCRRVSLDRIALTESALRVSPLSSYVFIRS